MKIKERILSGELPSVIIFEMLSSAALWQDASDKFASEFPGVDSIISSLRKLSSSMYNKDKRSVETLDYLILLGLFEAGFSVIVPVEPT
jgi:hypothetical protein